MCEKELKINQFVIDYRRDHFSKGAGYGQEFRTNATIKISGDPNAMDDLLDHVKEYVDMLNDLNEGK